MIFMGCFTSAVRPDEADNLPRTHLDRRVAESRDTTEVDGHAVDHEGRGSRDGFGRALPLFGVVLMPLDGGEADARRSSLDRGTRGRNGSIAARATALCRRTAASLPAAMSVLPFC